MTNKPTLSQVKSQTKERELLQAVALAFENGRDPFNTVFLRENQVSLDDCRRLGDLLAIILRAYIWAPDWARKAMLASGSIEEPDAAAVWERMRQEWR
ncbi:MAG: hypothetical protein C4567_18750 [Deltaproteobacteria bacterium]|nr:MAG: hypothetical protein C4567_18750 [Deltaproteobacteria bacterium]